ncbi:Panacea domain-containing protein [Methylocapsa aurea]|uniref:Panacea domain-containing protein n=1 Tax=Methylocapsa aurea TaxID=663610 RepID=UPI003D18CC34
MYEARKIANFLLQKFDARTFDISNMKMNKLLYFIQGWGYVILDRKIIRNHFVAWEYGPVIRSIYESFKEFEAQPISAPAKFLNYETGKLEDVAFDELDHECVELVMKILPFYVEKSASELVAMTHVPGGPWESIYKLTAGRQPIFQHIPDDLISTYFKTEFGGTKRH